VVAVVAVLCAGVTEKVVGLAARFSQRFFSVLWMADIVFRGSNDTGYLIECYDPGETTDDDEDSGGRSLRDEG